ncbi:MAG: aminotransferase class I/II-fold pyridoxal phosphate-dependent enzyme [Lentimicrobiaceae bacterium]|jgi:aspartate/methionine/tyrosine aminotransferase
MDNGQTIITPSSRTELVQEYYFSQKLRQIDEMRKSGLDIINLGIGSPDLPPAPAVVEKLGEAAKLPNVHGYQSYNGIPALRKAFADWYEKYFHVTLNPDNEILPLIGSKEGIMHISMAFVNEGDEVLVPNPGYPTYTSVSKLTGGKVRFYDLNEKQNWHPDLHELENSDLSKVKIMWVNYPHMPTGARGNKKLFENLVAFAHRHTILMVNDNPYSFILNKDHLSLLSVDGAKEVALELNSMSKSHNMAGWRIGMVAGHAEYIQSIVKVKSNMDSGMFQPMQLAAVEALRSPDEWYDSINETYGQRRKLVEQIMIKLQCTFDPNQTGLFVWGKIPAKYSNAEELTEEILHKAHVFITPGMVFGGQGNGYIRISLCANEQMLGKALKRLAGIGDF